MNNFLKYFFLTSVVFAVFLLFAVGCQNKGQSFQTILKQHYQNKVEAFKEENPNLKTGQIVFIGDSITEGYNLNQYYNDLSLQAYNRGIGGDITSGVLNRLEVSVFAVKPQKVVLMIGINDICSDYQDEKIIENYQNILEQIQVNLNEGEIYVMSILPLCANFQNRDTNQINQRIKGLNNQIMDLANQKDFIYVDLFSLVVDSNNCLNGDLSNDGIHLNDQGYIIWTNLMNNYFKS